MAQNAKLLSNINLAVKKIFLDFLSVIRFQKI